MFEMVILPLLLFMTWLLVKTVPWILAALAVLLIIGLIVERRANK